MPETAIDGIQYTIGGSKPSWPAALLVLPRPGIGAPVAHERPAVVRARLQDVDFVAAVRPVLVQPHLAGARMHRQAERAAMAERVDLGPGIGGLADERIVFRHAAVVVQPQHLPAEAVQPLGGVAADGDRRDVELAVAAERDLRRADIADEDVLRLGERVVSQFLRAIAVVCRFSSSGFV